MPPVESHPDGGTGTWVGSPTGPYAHVYAGHSHYTWDDSDPMTPPDDPPDFAAGICVDNLGVNHSAVPGFYFDGGSIEYGADQDDGTVPRVPPGESGGEKPDGGIPGAYVVADGDEHNRNPGDPVTGTGANEIDGYIGISNYESNDDTDPACNGDDDDPDRGSNSGWCTWVHPNNPPDGAGVPTPIVGGSESGTFDDGDRDGWRVP